MYVLLTFNISVKPLYKSENTLFCQPTNEDGWPWKFLIEHLYVGAVICSKQFSLINTQCFYRELKDVEQNSLVSIALAITYDRLNSATDQLETNS